MTEETELIQLLINTFFVIVECLFMQICHQSLLQKRRCAFQVTNVKNHGYYAAGNVTGSVQLCENTGCCLAIYRITNGQWKVDTLGEKAPCPNERLRKNNSFKHQESEITKAVVMVAILFLTVLIVIAVKWRKLCKEKKEYLQSACKDYNIQQQCSCQIKASENQITDIELQGVLGRGHFATVYQGKQRGSVVAVKVYTANWKHQFINEKGVYELPLMKHERILQFLGTEWKPDDSSLLIVLQYAEHGSLHSFLCKHASSWMLSMRLCQSLSEGLSYLHSDLHVHKPPVAHRDLTSSNVLVRADGTCVLCDFGSSTILRSCSGHRFWRNHSTTMTGHLQFCTLNYMSPEILEGSVNLSSSSFLLQGDIYALGLILWEIWMRCSDLFTGGAVPEHLLPYELELDADVTLERLILFVSEMDRRPSIPGNWEMLPQGLGLKELLTDCWDRDTDARLSAPCVVNRLMSL
uniref:receptor protein serine/threonine kinase n=1 Tax=Xiphophorus maculatus TaxID=8083 RepID=A0A3B5PY59_XIPMA